MPRPFPCLWFDTQAEEAAAFYVEVFPNSEITRITRYPDRAPDDSPWGGERLGTVLTVEVTLDGTPFMLLNGGPQFTFSESVSFVIETANQIETDYFWDRLTDGGQESQCGWLTDRFGVSWQVSPTRLTELLMDPDAGRAARAMAAMLPMQRIDIAVIEAAADAS